MNGKSRISLICLSTICLVNSSTAQAEGDRQLLEFVRDAHRATRESIQTFSCNVKFLGTRSQEGKPSVSYPCSGIFWLTDKTMRAKVFDVGDRNMDLLWDDGVRKTVSHKVRGAQEIVGAGRGSFTNRHRERCDPFVRGLLVFKIPSSSSINYVPLEELVERATKLKKAEQKTVDGKEMLVVQLLFDRTNESRPAWNVDIYFDPTVNYLARKLVSYDSTLYLEEEVLEFKEHQPGLFFPAHVIGSSQALPQKYKFGHSETKFSDVQINQVLPKDIFDFKYPQGIILSDNIRGCEYRVDANGNQISEATPYEHEVPPPSRDLDGKTSGTETQEEPKPASRWILPISFGLLIAGGVAAFLRRRRRQAESA